ncbi:MAG TPA: M67 family metallopeptidase [Terracidiphilus sp.]|nr:M67 family metallopeptidase [Terracidiphilus sp.]
MSVLRISREVYGAMRAHGEETYPQECCGALLGRAQADGWRVEAMVRAENARGKEAGMEAARSRYEIAPAELVRIEREARGRGLEIAGFYHSHPDHPARWSETDLEEAHWVGCAYVITEVVRGKAAATRAFLLAGRVEEDKQFVEVEVALVNAGRSSQEEDRRPDGAT